ncbi:hypothetical protein B0H13DRAFT_2358457 [Mycena leptocephala]|nr:hypothetical protein B0H13DRAFT_2358457 [Mycena leptocephala]
MPSSASWWWRRRRTVIGGWKEGQALGRSWWWRSPCPAPCLDSILTVLFSAVTVVSFSQQSILDHPPFLIYVYQFHAVLLRPGLSCPPPPSALALGVWSMQSPPLPVLPSCCPVHARCFCCTRVRTCALTTDSYRSRTSRSVSASAASLPPLAQPTHALTLVHALPASGSPGHTLMRDPLLTASRYPPLAPYASRHPLYRSQSRSHTLYFCPLVRTIHPSDPSAR